MRLGQTFQHVVALDAADKARALVVEGVQHRTLDQPRVDSCVQVCRQRAGLADRPHQNRIPDIGKQQLLMARGRDIIRTDKENPA